MATPRSHGGRLGGAAPCWLSVLRTGLFLTGAQIACGQHAPAAAAPAARMLTISVVSRAARSCGAGLSSPVVQREIETRVRAAGIAVSNVHAAQLASDMDCIALVPGERAAGVSVHHCLSLSEPVLLASQEGRVMLATTWRECQSYTCAGKCEATLRNELRRLVDAFVAAYDARGFRRDAAQPMAPPQARPAAFPGPAQAPAPQARRSTGVFSRVAPAPDHALARVVFYPLYILTCLAVLLRWRARARMERNCPRIAGTGC